MKPEPMVSSIQEETPDPKPSRNPDSITVNKELDNSLADNESTGIRVFPGDDPDGLLSDIHLDMQRSKKAHIDEMSEMKAEIERLQSERRIKLERHIDALRNDAPDGDDDDGDGDDDDPKSPWLIPKNPVLQPRA